MSNQVERDPCIIFAPHIFVVLERMKGEKNCDGYTVALSFGLEII